MFEVAKLMLKLINQMTQADKTRHGASLQVIQLKFAQSGDQRIVIEENACILNNLKTRRKIN